MAETEGESGEREANKAQSTNCKYLTQNNCKHREEKQQSNLPAPNGGNLNPGRNWMLRFIMEFLAGTHTNTYTHAHIGTHITEVEGKQLSGDQFGAEGIGSGVPR